LRSDLFEGLVRKCAAPIHDFRVLSTATAHVGVKDGLLLAVVHALPVLRSGPPPDRISGLIRLPIRRPRKRTRSVDYNGKARAAQTRGGNHHTDRRKVVENCR
jgi:hypothetical protein